MPQFRTGSNAFSGRTPMAAKVRYLLARTRANDLLRKGKVNAAPVPVEELAGIVGAEIRFEPYPDGELAGMCLRKSDGTGIIGVNATHPITRRRFTIAHELGHFLLHADGVHVDERIPLNPIGLRYGSTSQSADPKEIEANAFAADLLMPLSLLRKEALPSDFGADDDIARLAARYDVSVQAMTIRLTTLRLK